MALGPNEYPLGHRLWLMADFSIDELNTGQYVLRDPATIALKVTKGDGVTETKQKAELTRFAEGRFGFPYELNVLGQWLYQWVSTGAVMTASDPETGHFTVVPHAVT